MQVKFDPSPQQRDIFEWIVNGSGCAVVEAVAGAGKTTTLVEAVTLMQGRVFFGAYNKAIATEIAERIKGKKIYNVKASTMHAAGFAAWMKAYPNVQIDGGKVYNLVDLHVPDKGARTAVHKLVSLAKQELADPTQDMAWNILIDRHDLMGETNVSRGELVSYSQRVLLESIKLDKTSIDFDDMIHAPLCHGAEFPQYDWVLIDEAQDTNPARRLLARKLLKSGGRLIAVGDSRQAIYGFAGASSDSLDKLSDMFGCVRLPLTITYRCPKAVVKLAHTWVDHIQAHESAPEGKVRSIGKDEIFSQQLTGNDVVICRYVKPLVELAHTLLRLKVPCHVEGRDVGKSLIALIRKMRSQKLTELEEKLKTYQKAETEKFTREGDGQKIDALNDKVETLLSLSEVLRNEGKYAVADLIKHLEDIFMDTQEGKPSRGVTLATVHKSKGREWERVFLLGRDMFMPSKYATQDWQMAQENNLIYVAVTRAKRELVDVNYKQ